MPFHGDYQMNGLTIAKALGAKPWSGTAGLIVDQDTRAAVRTWLNRMGWATQEYINLDVDTLKTIYAGEASYETRKPHTASTGRPAAEAHATSDYAPRNERLLASLKARGIVDGGSPVLVPAAAPAPVAAAPLPAIPGMIDYDPALLAKVDALGAIVGAPSIASMLHKAAAEAVGAASAYKAALEDAASRGTMVVSAPVACAGYIPPAWAKTLWAWISLGRVVALVGPAGNGKTTAARKELEGMGYEVFEVDCTEDTTAGDVIGRRTLEARDGVPVAVYQHGPVARAMMAEKGAVLMNEYDALDPRVGMAFQSLFEFSPEGKRRVTLPEIGEQLVAVGDCPIVLTLNTLGNGASRTYVGRNALDGANKDRVEIVTTAYEADAERLQAHGAKVATAKYLAGWEETMRQRIDQGGMRVTLSFRRLMAAADLMDRAGRSRDEALDMAFFGRLEANEALALR